MDDKCECALCDPIKHSRANELAQDIILTKRKDLDDEVNGIGFLMAAAAIAKMSGMPTLHFATIAAKAFTAVEVYTDKELH